MNNESTKLSRFCWDKKAGGKNLSQISMAFCGLLIMLHHVPKSTFITDF